LKRSKELDQWDQKINELKEEYNSVLTKNTGLLEEYVQMTNQKHHLEGALNTKQSSVNVEFFGTKTREDYDFERLEALSKEQETQLAALKSEIAFLISKPHKPIQFKSASESSGEMEEDEEPLPLPLKYPTANTKSTSSLLIDAKQNSLPQTSQGTPPSKPPSLPRTRQVGGTAKKGHLERGLTPMSNRPTASVPEGGPLQAVGTNRSRGQQ
jgi:hypothetical protein